MAQGSVSKKKSCDTCYKKCGKGRVPEEILNELDSAMEKLEASPHMSLLKKYLTRDVFEELRDLQTPLGATLWDCIRSGVINLDSNIGVYAADAQCYTVFDLLFDKVIEDYHLGFKKISRQPPCDWGNIRNIGNVDPTSTYVVSTRVRCGRSLDGYPFNPKLTEAQYKEMEAKVSTVLRDLKGDHKGTYYPLTGMAKDVQQQLIDDHFLFKEGDRFLEAANANRFWPTGRGIFYNTSKTFLVWVNEEDHLRIISMQNGGDLCAVYGRLVEGVRKLEKKLTFSRHSSLGYLTFCPTNLGTTIRASVLIKLPKLSADKARMESVASNYNLQVRGSSGEHSDAKGGLYDISNKRRIGLTEYEAVKEMHDGVIELINIEKSMK
ncbi:ATP:guanido phosphotransferase, C-terminal catalytic domain [Popillia japonica]|uniref:arginine kinase n=1 Tax=Popillia japonica TaxID=7064 RepID=A0AAW1NAW2_POPJA